MDENEVMLLDTDDFNDSDRLVLSIISNSGKSIMRTRLQKSALVYSKVFGDIVKHIAYSFGGYSEDVDESVDTLLDVGAITDTKNGYALTPYGKNMADFLRRVSSEYVDVDAHSKQLSNALNGVSDRELVGLTYHLYPETSEGSIIKESVDRLNKTLSVNGKDLSDFDLKSFEREIKAGNPIKVTEKRGRRNGF